MRGIRIVMCALGLGMVLLGVMTNSAQAGKGGQPPDHSCGIGRAEAAFLREISFKPGAGEAALLDPNDPEYRCTGRK